MYNTKSNIYYDLISSASFYVDAVSAAHRYVEPPNTYLRYANEHKHDRIICVVSGKCKFDIFNDKPIIAKSGDVVYIPYNIAYRAEWDGSEKGEIYSINYIMYNQEGHKITMCPEIYLFSTCDNFLTEGLFAECWKIFQSESFGYALKCKYTFLKLLYTLVTSENEQQHSKIGKALRYIESNFLEEISVTELAKMCNLGECMFRRCFKSEMGISPLKYRNRLRINKAYELLVAESCSVSEAMEFTGFYDASYFNKTFKSFIGKTPSECKSKRNISI